jgi:hypothetical protein
MIWALTRRGVAERSMYTGTRPAKVTQRFPDSSQ